MADGGQQLLLGQGRVEDERDVGIAGQLFHQTAADGGLAGAHLAGQQHKTATLAQAERQVRQRLAVAITHVEKLRVRRDGKRILGEAEIVIVHRDHGLLGEAKV